MIITLAIVIGMIVMIMSDKFAFGAPPLIACVLLVLTGCATMSEAFAGFVDKNVIMIAGFMVVMAALEKTSLIDKVKATMFNMASKGGYRNYILLLIVVMLGASVMSGTGYYVLVLSLVSTIPYNKNLPISKIFMPLGYATYNPIVPVNMAFYVGLVASLLESSGVTGTAVPLLVYSGIKLVSSIAFWCGRLSVTASCRTTPLPKRARRLPNKSQRAKSCPGGKKSLCILLSWSTS